MNKVIKSIVVIITILFLLSPFSFAANTGEEIDVDFKEQIKAEEGSLFEKIIAECIRWYCTNHFGFYHIF